MTYRVQVEVPIESSAFPSYGELALMTGLGGCDRVVRLLAEASPLNIHSETSEQVANRDYEHDEGRRAIRRTGTFRTFNGTQRFHAEVMESATKDECSTNCRYVPGTIAKRDTLEPIFQQDGLEW